MRPRQKEAGSEDEPTPTPSGSGDESEVQKLLAQYRDQAETIQIEPEKYVVGRNDREQFRNDPQHWINMVRPRNVPGPDGKSEVLLTNVRRNSAAAQAYGVQSNDILISINGVPVDTKEKAYNYVRKNPDLGRYKIPCSADVPELVTILVPTYEPSGPFGAKSVSEISINGPLPAIANAIHDAVGVRLHQAPFTPERVLASMRSRPA